MLAHEPTAADQAGLDGLNAQIADGTMSKSAALTQIANLADGTVALAETAYQFFTGRTPTQAGLNWLVSSPANPTDLNDPYYAGFSMENRYINFAVNLGKFGEGAGGFAAKYGAMSLGATFKDAYAVIFGVVPTDAKVAAMVDPRAGYFAYYGQDGATGVGTKAAAVGWLLAEAVKADTGTYATAVNNFLLDLSDGSAQHNVDLVGVYGPNGTALPLS
jgi:serralysin